jgi:branched-chain amino acid transport system permease protein
MVDAATLFQVTVTGVGLGAVYALVAIGFSLIYKVTGVLNFAQGQLALLGAYLVVILSTPLLIAVELPAAVAVLATLVFGLLLGVVLERVVFRQFIGEPVLSVIIVTLALGGIITGLIRFLIGPQYRAYPDALSPGWSLPLPLGVDLSASFTLGVAFSLVVLIALMLFFRYTVLGSILRAGASDQQAAMVLGISIERTILLAWALSIAITSVGGLLFAMSSGGAGFNIEAVGILIFAAVVFGGLDSIPGAFIGSIVVGLIQNLGTYYADPVIGSGFGQVLPMIFLLVVILVKPYGLFGTERIERL